MKEKERERGEIEGERGERGRGKIKWFCCPFLFRNSPMSTK